MYCLNHNSTVNDVCISILRVAIAEYLFTKISQVRHLKPVGDERLDLEG